MSEGPDLNNLRGLSEMLPSYAEGLKKRTIAKNRTKAPVSRPTAICEVCCAQCDFKTTDEIKDLPMLTGKCDRCRKLLDDGYVALVAGDQFAFVKSPRLQDMAGQIVQISGANMDKVAKEHGVQTEERHQSNGHDGNPSA